MELSKEELKREADKAEANFRLLWSLFSEDGRGVALAGMEEVSEDIKTVVRNSYIVGASPVYDIEVPLMGEHQMDITVGYYADELPEKLNLVSNNLPHMQRYFDHYLELHKNLKSTNEICYEFDASSGNIQNPAFGYIPDIRYDEPRSIYKERMEDFLTLVGQINRADKAFEIYEKSPDYWKPYYQGIAMGRENYPMRITWLLNDDCRKIYHDDPGQLERDLESIGVDYDRETMIKPMLEFFKIEGIFELQADLFANGKVGSSIGLIGFIKQEHVSADENIYFQDYIDFGQKWGVADERIVLLMPRTRYKTIPYYDDENGILHKRLVSGPSNVKIKWIDKKMMPMKAYVFLKSYLMD